MSFAELLRAESESWMGSLDIALGERAALILSIANGLRLPLCTLQDFDILLPTYRAAAMGCCP